MAENPSEQELSFEEWCAALDAHHEAMRAAGVFVGYGPGSTVAKTGAAAWRSYYDDGFCPEDALSEDRECWGG